MFNDAAILLAVARELAKDPGLPVGSVSLRSHRGVVYLEGELPDIGSKRRILGHAGRAEGLAGLVDRLSIKPRRRFSDGILAQRLGHAFLAEPAFIHYQLCGGPNGCLPQVFRLPVPNSGSLAFSIRRGTVTLKGAVPSLRDKCLAGMLAWKTGGTTDVINAMAAQATDETANAAIEGMIRQSLANLPLLAGAGIQVRYRAGIAWLSGIAGSSASRQLAEYEAWCVFGVERIVNRIRTKTAD